MKDLRKQNGGIGGIGRRYGTKKKDKVHTFSNSYTTPTVDNSKNLKEMDKYNDVYGFHKPPYPGREPQLEDYANEATYNKTYDDWQKLVTPYDTYIKEQEEWDRPSPGYEKKVTSWGSEAHPSTRRF